MTSPKMAAIMAKIRNCQKLRKMKKLMLDLYNMTYLDSLLLFVNNFGLFSLQMKRNHPFLSKKWLDLLWPAW